MLRLVCKPQCKLQIELPALNVSLKNEREIGCGDEQFYRTTHIFGMAVMLGCIFFQKLCAIS